MKQSVNKLFFLLLCCAPMPHISATPEDDLALIAQLAPEKNHQLSLLCEKLHKKEALSQNLIENGCVEAFECLTQAQNTLSQEEIEQLKNSIEAAYDQLLEHVDHEELPTKAAKKIFSQVVVRHQLSSGSVYVGGDVVIDHNLEVNNNVIVQGSETIHGNLIVQGATIFSGTNVVTPGNQTINGNLTVLGNTTTNGIQSTGTNTLTGPTNINTSGAAPTNIGNCPNSTTTISGTTNINTTGACATNIGDSSNSTTLQGTIRNIGDTFMSAPNGVVLTVTGNTTNPSTVLVGNSTPTAPALKLINNPAGSNTDFFLTIDSSGVVKQTPSNIQSGFIINGCQPGPLMIGTTNGTSLSLNTGSGICNQRMLIDANGGITIQTPAGGETGLTIAGGGASVTGTTRLIGNTFMSAPAGMVLTITGNSTTVPVSIASPNASITPLQLINVPATVIGDNNLFISTDGFVRQGPAGVGAGTIVNGCQSGPLTIGTTNGSSLSLNTGSGVCNQRILIDANGGVTIQTPAGGETGLTIVGGGASVTGPTNINTSGTATTNVGTANGATNIGGSTSTNTVQGTTNVIGNTFMSAASGVVLTVTGNATNPSTVLVGNSGSINSTPLKLVGLTSATPTNALNVDSFGNVYVGTNTAISVTTTFTISTTGYIVPTNARNATLTLVGGGGGGGGQSLGTYSAGGGGGSGAVIAQIPIAPGTRFNATVGAFGAGGSASYGGNGGNTAVTFNGAFTITAIGGTGGGGGSTVIPPNFAGGAGGALATSASISGTSYPVGGEPLAGASGGNGGTSSGSPIGTNGGSIQPGNLGGNGKPSTNPANFGGGGGGGGFTMNSSTNGAGGDGSNTGNGSDAPGTNTGAGGGGSAGCSPFFTSFGNGGNGSAGAVYLVYFI